MIQSLCLAIVSAFLLVPLTASWMPRPQGPTVVLSVPATALVDEVVLIDARGSTGVSNQLQGNGTPSLTIALGDGKLAHIPATGHAFRDAGLYTVIVTGRSANGAVGSASKQITVTEIPTALPANVQILTDANSLTANATNLQNAINRACGTTEQEIHLPDNFKALGPVTMQPCASGKYTTIRWASLSRLPHKKRVRPDLVDLSAMPTIYAPNESNWIIPAVNVPHPQPARGVDYYRWQGIRFARQNNNKPAQLLFQSGHDTYNGNNSLEKASDHIIVDRCWFDAGPPNSATFQSGFRVMSNYTSVVDCFFGYFRLVGAGVDAEAMSMSNGHGLSVRNNTLIASSENFNSGGGGFDYRDALISNATTTSTTLSDGRHLLLATNSSEPSPAPTTNLAVDSIIALPSSSCKNGGPYCVEMVTRVTSISGNNITFEPVPYVPSGRAQWADGPHFLEFRENYLTKPNSWRRFLADGVTPNPEWDGADTQIKNIWECKSCRYTVLEGNILTNTWIKDQPYAFVLTVRNRSGGYALTAAIQYLQVSNNLFRNMPNGINISGSDDGVAQDQVAAITKDLLFLNNLFMNIGSEWDRVGAKTFMRLGSVAFGVDKLRRVFVVHHTFDGSIGTIVDFAPLDGAVDSAWLNNAHPFGWDGFRTSTSNPPEAQVATIAKFLPPGDTSNWNKNVVVNPRQPYQGAVWYAPMPSGAIVLGGIRYDGAATPDTVDWRGQFVDPAKGNFTLKVGHLGKGAATDGKDVGVDMVQLAQALGASPTDLTTSRVYSGDWTGNVPQPSPTATPQASPTVTPSPSPTPSPVPASPNGTKGVTVVDSSNGVWTLGANGETLRNGTHMAGGLGTVYLWLNQAVYVLGTDQPANWYRWSGVKWELVGASEPMPSASPSPTVAPSPIVTPTPVSSPSPLPSPTVAPSPTPETKIYDWPDTGHEAWWAEITRMGWRCVPYTKNGRTTKAFCQRP